MIPKDLKKTTAEEIQEIIYGLAETTQKYQDAFDMTKEPQGPTTEGVASQLMTAALSSLEAAVYLLKGIKRPAK